jgi:hypothetical protein
VVQAKSERKADKKAQRVKLVYGKTGKWLLPDNTMYLKPVDDTRPFFESCSNIRRIWMFS